MLRKQKVYLLNDYHFSSTIPYSWLQIIQYLENQFKESCSFKNTFDSQRIITQIGTVHEFIRQEWDENHRCPLHPPNIRPYENHGALFARTLDMCSKCHIRNTIHAHFYPNSVSWIYMILKEYIIFRGLGNNKSNMIDNIQHDNKLLTNYVNPFDFQYHPCTWQLIEDCRLWAENKAGNVFREKSWNPFLAARKELPKTLSKPIWVGNCLDKNGNARLSIGGKGKGSICAVNAFYGDQKNFENNAFILGISWGGS